MAIIFDKTKKSYFCLTKEQYIKLFSNPVSGIAFDMNGHGTNYDYAHGAIWYLKDIRYSKSMLLNALYFWEKQIKEFYRRLKRAEFNPTFKIKFQGEDNILDKIMLVHNFPDSFLFSHRHIELKSGKYSKSMDQQLQLLNKKYPLLMEERHGYGYQENTLQPFYRFKTTFDLEFTIFPNEHPYIPRQRIKNIGKTDKDNVYVIFGKNE